MKPQKVRESFEKLKDFCERENYQGWDPFDGLNSQIFQALPVINRNKYFRLAWIQFYKRSNVNLRRITFVRKDFNSKGLGLFLTGYCNLYKLTPNDTNLEKISFLAEKLIELKSINYSGACWGYNFDWQARAFFQPKQTPTVVATSFVADALLNAVEITGNAEWRKVAISAADFVRNDLNRTYDEMGNFAFSYSPLDKTQVFNASLLGARLLSRVYHLTGDEMMKNEAEKAVRFVCERQGTDGSWAYGTLGFHQWIDNFHTGFNLECLYEYQKYTGDSSIRGVIEKGLNYYLSTFFTRDGIAKYYNNQTYPIDIHSPAQLIVTLAKLNEFENNRGVIDRVTEWTIDNMQSKKGYFYYQKKKWISSRIPYMRWAQAWMFYSLSYYLLNNNCLHEKKN